MTWVTLALAFVRKNWQAFAIAAAIGAAWWWHASTVNAAAKAAEKATHAHYAGVLANIRDLTAQAAKDFREREQKAQSAIEKEAKDGQTKLDRARADAAGARTAAAGLRQQLDAYRRAAARSATHPGAATTGIDQPSATAIDLLAKLLERHTEELVEVGGYADQLRAVGETCERAYDQVQQALNDHAQTR